MRNRLFTAPSTFGYSYSSHGLRNCFITVAECDLFLPLSLTKRLVNHTRPSEITEGYAADWSIDSCTNPRSVSPTR